MIESHPKLAHDTVDAESASSFKKLVQAVEQAQFDASADTENTAPVAPMSTVAT